MLCEPRNGWRVLREPRNGVCLSKPVEEAFDHKEVVIFRGKLPAVKSRTNTKPLCWEREYLGGLRNNHGAPNWQSINGRKLV